MGARMVEERIMPWMWPCCKIIKFKSEVMIHYSEDNEDLKYLLTYITPIIISNIKPLTRMESTHFQSQHSLNHTCYKNINKLIYRKQIGTVYFSLDRFVCSFHFGIDSNLFNNRRIRVSIITGPTFDKCHLKPNILFTFVSLKSKTCESIRRSSLLNKFFVTYTPIPYIHTTCMHFYHIIWKIWRNLSRKMIYVPIPFLSLKMSQTHQKVKELLSFYPSEVQKKDIRKIYNSVVKIL